MRVKHLFPIILVAGLSLLNACNSKRTTDETKQADSSGAAIQTETTTPTEVALSPAVEQLVGEPTGLFRGISIGDPIAAVKQKEKIEQFETSPNHVGYTFEYPNLESVDILYFYDKAGDVDKIDVDLYLNDEKSLKTFNQELTGYFNQRFGKMAQNGADKTWEAAGAKLVMKDVSKEKNYGLKVTFTGEEGAMTAKK